MSEFKKCPHCGEQILAVAKKCKYCREWLEEKSEKSSDETKMYSSQRTETIIEPTKPIDANVLSSQRNQGVMKDVYIKVQYINDEDNEEDAVYIGTPKKWLIDEFIIKDGILTITTKKGSCFSAPISEVVVGCANTNVGKKYTFMYGGKKTIVVEALEMLSDEEWKVIKEIVESLPNYGLSTLGAIQKAFLIAGTIVCLFSIVIWLVKNYIA